MHSDQGRDQVRSLQVSLGDESDREPCGSLCWVSQKARPIPPIPAPDFPTISDQSTKTHRRPQGAAPRRTHSAEGQNGSCKPAARAAKNCHRGIPKGERVHGVPPAQAIRRARRMEVNTSRRHGSSAPPLVPGSKDPARGSLVVRGHGEADAVPVNQLADAVCKKPRRSRKDKNRRRQQLF